MRDRQSEEGRREILEAYRERIVELLATWIRNELVKEAKARALAAAQGAP